MKKSRKRKRTGSFRVRCLMAVVLVMIISLLICAGVVIYGFPAPIQAQIDILPDQNARAGTLHAEEAVEVSDGEFWLVMNQLPTMEEGSLDCNIEYENPVSNQYSARASLYLQEDGKLLGSTRRVDPGNYVETIRLKKKLPPGEYPVTVKLELFEQKKPVGEMSVNIILRVTGEIRETEERQEGEVE